jgi:exopolysaccharide biosynthesis polyprenyl glycosylphosphotransferase
VAFGRAVDAIELIIGDVGVPDVAPSTSVRSIDGLRLRPVLIGVDVVGFALAWLLALRFEAPADLHLLVSLVLVVGAASVTTLGLSLYVTSVIVQRRLAYRRLAVAAAVSAIVANFVLPTELGGMSVVEAGALLSFAIVCTGRCAFDMWLSRCRASGRFTRRVVIVGDASEARTLLQFLALNAELGLHPCALVGSHRGVEELDVPWLGPIHTARRAAEITGATGAIVLCNGISSDDLTVVIRDLAADGLHVHLSNGLLGLEPHRLRPISLGQEPFLYVRPAMQAPIQQAVKRALDAVLALVLVVLTSPVLLLAALAVKVGDRGPVFFRQTRVGRDGRLITIHKLRTMVVDAEQRLAEVRHLNERDGPLFKITEDPRVTRIGRFLRASSIDELPQLFDVVLGRMSLVGPRPALPEEVALFDGTLGERARVRPGVTGLWQVKARDKDAFESYRRLDRFYVDNWSLGLDLRILAATIPVVLERTGRSLYRRNDRTRAGRSAGQS